MSMTRCECLRWKDPGAEACQVCMSLDGETYQDRRLIGALRAAGGTATTEAIMTESGWSKRQVLRALERLKASGRVLRVETREEKHILNPIFTLVEVVAVPVTYAEDDEIWGQLVFSRPTSGWVAICRCRATVPVFAVDGREVARQCIACLEATATTAPSIFRLTRRDRPWEQLVAAVAELAPSLDAWGTAGALEGVK